MIWLHRALPALMVVLLLAAGHAGAQTLYKYIGPNGKIVYSDTPPPPGVKFEKLQPNTAPTGVDLRPRGGAAPADERGKEVDARLRERKQKQDEQAEKTAGLQRIYDSARAALEAGRDPREGERSVNANGTSRLSEEYFRRIEQLEQNVEQSRQRLEEAQRQ
jgi:hypothetical protein